MQEIILVNDVDGLGRRGTVARVKNGYALNFLIPSGVAVRATADNLGRLEHLREQFEAEENERKEKAAEACSRLEAVSVTIPMKASEEGHLYGSVTSATIIEALGAEGHEVDERVIKLAEPIKEVGVYEVPFVFHEEVKVEVKVWVVEEKEASDEAAPEAAPEAADSGTGDSGPEDAAPEGKSSEEDLV